MSIWLANIGSRIALHFTDVPIYIYRDEPLHILQTSKCFLSSVVWRFSLVNLYIYVKLLQKVKINSFAFLYITPGLQSYVPHKFYIYLYTTITHSFSLFADICCLFAWWFIMNWFNQIVIHCAFTLLKMWSTIYR